MFRHCTFTVIVSAARLLTVPLPVGVTITVYALAGFCVGIEPPPQEPNKATKATTPRSNGHGLRRRPVGLANTITQNTTGRLLFQGNECSYFAVVAALTVRVEVVAPLVRAIAEALAVIAGELTDVVKLTVPE
jgi:hypothetical protein